MMVPSAVPNAQSLIRLHPADDVAIALADLPAGSQPPDLPQPLLQPIPRGHKLALKPVQPGMPVRRYGQIIGTATQPIAAGEHVHTQNLGMGDHVQDHAFGADLRPLPPVQGQRNFMGYRRADGRVGTRNYLGIVTTVNCSGSVARMVAEAAARSDLLNAFPGIDGIVPIAHGTGCGMADRGAGYDLLLRTLGGYARHPNFAGVLILGLGCEVMQLPALTGGAAIRPDGQMRFLSIQGSGGTRRTIEACLQQLAELAAGAARATREPVPAAELMIGMQCGGSDGYSGITANPALGNASDLLVRHGGTTILSETPEIYGAEHLLTRRAVSAEVGQRLLDLIAWWEAYTARNGGEMNNNPSPGNKRGGLTTILEKSLGAVAKGGTAPLSAVYRFAEPITARGFVYMDSPGFDPCSVTGQIASGANLIVFTTGRGSVSGYQPVPCIKLATNSEMYARMSEDMDLNCGDIVSDGVSIAAKGEELFELILRIASGEQTRSEAQGFGGVEFVPWQIGAVM